METTQLTLGFFLIQAVVVFMIAWIFVLFIIRNKRRRTESLRLFQELVKLCSGDARLNELVNIFTESTLVYMQYLASSRTSGDEPRAALESLNALQAYCRERGYVQFIDPELEDGGKLYKSVMLMKLIYHKKVKE